MAYSKLYSSIVHSSLWTEPDHIRLLFITLLAIADREGFVYASRGGLLRLANLDPGQCDEINPFDALMSPDEDSSDKLRNPENEGRRIEEVPGGFRILNYTYYRGLRNEDDRREQNRAAQERFRNKKKVSPSKPRSAKVSHSHPSPSASAFTSVSEKGECEGVPTADDIYAAYPKKVAKPEAIRAIEKALKTSAAAHLLERTVAYAKTQPANSQYTPHPSTWFNQERFNDDPSTWTPTADRPKPAKEKPRFRDVTEETDEQRIRRQLTETENKLGSNGI